LKIRKTVVFETYTQWQPALQPPARVPKWRDYGAISAGTAARRARFAGVPAYVRNLYGNSINPAA
jgi:hypothetical protein